ncbi:MAG: hypothetical protein QOE96_2492, partial [Blastocatellia bacterium]|nr:hypothetical protein [Blastocatellia bacterium]
KFAQRQKELAILSEQINAVRHRLEAGQTLEVQDASADPDVRKRSGAASEN